MIRTQIQANKTQSRRMAEEPTERSTLGYARSEKWTDMSCQQGSVCTAFWKEIIAGVSASARVR
jgi:hypothetical protein